MRRNEYYAALCKAERYLSHHGVSGQKWGVQNGPPYPLDSSISTGKSLKDPQKTRHGVGPATAVALTAALDLAPFALAAGIAGIQSGNAYRKSKKYEKERKSAPTDEKTGLKLKTKDLSKKEDMKRVNPDYGRWSEDVKEGTRSNCVLCSMTYDLRRKGYDVTSAKTETGYTESFWKEIYPKAKVKNISGKDEYGHTSTKLMIQNTKKDLLSQGDGARGSLLVQWAFGFSGHSLVYEVNNGKINIIDCQSSEFNVNIDQLLKQCNPNGTQYVRLDNIDFDKKKVNKVIGHD